MIQVTPTILCGGSGTRLLPLSRDGYFRPTEVETLLGDLSNAKAKLGWVAEITAQELCAEMVAYDLAQAKQHALLK